jgi:hypothetical protein
MLRWYMYAYKLYMVYIFDLQEHKTTEHTIRQGLPLQVGWLRVMQTQNFLWDEDRHFCGTVPYLAPEVIITVCFTVILAGANLGIGRLGSCLGQ